MNLFSFHICRKTVSFNIAFTLCQCFFFNFSGSYKNMNTYQVSLSILALLIAIYIGRHYRNIGTNQPNIVFILADDLGYNDIGYHNHEIKSPNIDKVCVNDVFYL